MIGAHTKKVLRVIPKTSTCQACKRGNKPHICYRNHHGNAGSMEWTGMVQAFNEAPTKYGCYYLEYVGDGDSNVQEKIETLVSYGTHTKKLHCVNHTMKVKQTKCMLHDIHCCNLCLLECAKEARRHPNAV